MVHLERRLAARGWLRTICVHSGGQHCLSGKTITSFHEKTGEASSVMLSICQFMCSHLTSFRAVRSEDETNHQGFMPGVIVRSENGNTEFERCNPQTTGMATSFKLA
jgi:hypothetical protein